MAVFLPQSEIAYEVRQTEEECTKECKEGCVFKFRVYDAAY